MKEGSFDKGIPNLPHLQRRLKRPITTNINGYYYYVSPIESTPDAIDPLLLHEIAQEIINLGLTNDVDLIFCNLLSRSNGNSNRLHNSTDNRNKNVYCS